MQSVNILYRCGHPSTHQLSATLRGEKQARRLARALCIDCVRLAKAEIAARKCAQELSDLQKLRVRWTDWVHTVDGMGIFCDFIDLNFPHLRIGIDGVREWAKFNPDMAKQLLEKELGL